MRAVIRVEFRVAADAIDFIQKPLVKLAPIIAALRIEAIKKIRDPISPILLSLLLRHCLLSWSAEVSLCCEFPRILVCHGSLLSKVSGASLSWFQPHLVQDPSDAVHPNDLEEFLLFLEAVAGNRVLAVPVHLAPPTAGARVCVFAAALEAGADALIPKVEVEEGPVAVGDGRGAIL